MAIRKVWFGSLGPFFYDDAVTVIDPDGVVTEYQAGVVVDGQITVIDAPVGLQDVVRLEDLEDALTVLENGTANGQMLYWDHIAGAWKHTETSELVLDDTNKRVGINAATPTERLEIGGNLFLNADNNKVLLGAGKDLSIYYNGTNAVINPKEVGTGDLSVLGRIEEEGTFAEIHAHDNATTQSIPTGATYTKITTLDNNGESSNCTSDGANDKITVTKAGKYLVNGSFSFTCDTNNVTFFGSAFLNGVEQDNIHFTRKIGTASDVGSASFTGIIDVITVPWDLDVRFRHDNGGSITLTLSYANLNTIYLGET